MAAKSQTPEMLSALHELNASAKQLLRFDPNPDPQLVARTQRQGQVLRLARHLQNADPKSN
jgi:hypothetical protein